MNPSSARDVTPRHSERKENEVNDDDVLKRQKAVVLRHAPPPRHTIILVCVLTAACLYCFPSNHDLDEIATPATFSKVLFPQLLSIQQVAYIRLFFSAVIALDTLYAFLYGEWEQDTVYFPGSSLQPVQCIPFRGMFKFKHYRWTLTSSFKSGCMTVSSFTMWAWLLEGVTFWMLACIPLLQWYTKPWQLRCALLLWEIVAPTALLVSAIVKFVLWPLAINDTNGSSNQTNSNANVLKHPCALLEHNANCIFCLVEIGLLGGLPVRANHWAVTPLLGVVYVIFSWCMVNSWTIAADHYSGPQFIYPFFDTTLGWTTSWCLVGLLAVLSSFYFFVALVDDLVVMSSQYFYWQGDNAALLQHMMAVLIVTLLVCRFRD